MLFLLCGLKEGELMLGDEKSANDLVRQIGEH